MINVNWRKIKPFEKKSFALTAMAVLIILGAAAIVLGFVIRLILLPLKILTAVFIFLIFAFNVHIESRMLQIYMLLGILDIGLLFAALVPVNSGLTILLFIISAIGLAASLAMCIFSGIVMKKDTAYKSPEPDRSNIYSGKNVMFFAPHEDDEINVYGGIIEQYVKFGSQVRVVFSTNGDFHRLGRMRIRESLNVADKYGIPRDNFIFLGYSDSIENSDGLNIYNCPDDEELTSNAGFSRTYGSNRKAPYKNHAFTRKNMLSDVKSVILEYRPDTLFCCDYDSHADHRAIDLFFDEALGIILKENPLYRPTVYKGFAYSTAWDGKKDYYSINALSTHLKNPSDYMIETNIFNWKDRVRFPVAAESLSRVMQNNSSYKAMMEYSSQTATDHANGILNSDKVFWLRRTDSVLYDAKIAATSSDASCINEFKLVDSRNIKNQSALPLDSVWIADAEDKEKAILIKLPTPKKISSLAIYENPSDESHIMNAVISFGTVQYSTGELKPNGAATIFEFPPVKTSVIGIKIKSYVGMCSLSRIEAYEEAEDSRTQFIKLINSNDDFCYDYIINPSGYEDFNVYTYPHSDNFEFDLSSDNECLQYEVINGVIKIFCPEGEKGILTIKSRQNPAIYDKVLIRNPDDREREILRIKQKYEQIVLSPSMQWDYYRGLIRRLGTYFPFMNR